MSIPTKSYMKNTNMTLVFDKIHPCERWNWIYFSATPLTTLIFATFRRFPALWMHLVKNKVDIRYPRIEFSSKRH